MQINVQTATQNSLYAAETRSEVVAVLRIRLPNLRQPCRHWHLDVVAAGFLGALISSVARGRTRDERARTLNVGERFVPVVEGRGVPAVVPAISGRAAAAAVGGHGWTRRGWAGRRRRGGIWGEWGEWSTGFDPVGFSLAPSNGAWRAPCAHRPRGTWQRALDVGSALKRDWSSNQRFLQTVSTKVVVFKKMKGGGFLISRPQMWWFFAIYSTTEAIALRFGLNLARTANYKILRSTPTTWSDHHNARREPFIRGKSYFYDWHFMFLDFVHVIYDHRNRESNQLAHELARLARLSPPNLLMDSAL